MTLAATLEAVTNGFCVAVLLLSYTSPCLPSLQDELEALAVSNVGLFASLAACNTTFHLLPFPLGWFL